MASVATKPMTAEQFYEFANQPENRDRHFELEDGEIVEMSRPGKLHGIVCGNTAWLFGGYIRKIKRGQVCTNDAGLIVKRRPDTVRGPDISLYMENEKYDKIERRYSRNFPSVIVEVFSPTDRLGKMIKRIERFLAKGVQIAWLIEPEARTVTLFRRNQAPVVLEENQEIANLPEMPGFRCRASELFEVNED